MRRKVTCAKCKKNIEYKEDLVVGLLILFLQPYHEACFSRELKTYKPLILDGIPINGNLWTFNAIFFGPLGVMLLLFGEIETEVKWFVGLGLTYPAFFRILAYAFYERRYKGR